MIAPFGRKIKGQGVKGW